MRMIALAAVLAALVVAGPAAAQSSLPVPSEWTNKLGSVMTLRTIEPDGRLSGSYVTAVGCGRGVTRPLTGWFNGGAITFTVDWQECDSLTAWSGNLDQSGQTILTLWHLAQSGPPQWNSIFAGADVFSRTR